MRKSVPADAAMPLGQFFCFEKFIPLFLFNLNLCVMKLVHSDFLKFFGKVGDYVVYEWRGQLCLRRKPEAPFVAFAGLPPAPAMV